MIKDATYQEKFAILQPWVEEIIECVKKDLKNEHFSIDPHFQRKFFLGKDFNCLDIKTLAQAYSQDIHEGNVGLAEFIATRWLLKNTDIYCFFEEKVKSLNPDFESIDLLPEDFSETILKESIAQFGPEKSYIFAVFNSVVFPQEIYQKLKTDALQSKSENFNIKKEEEESVMKKRHEREIKALKDKYEKKLLGLQKKYVNDIQALKKEIAELKALHV